MRCPLLALSGHANHDDECPFFGRRADIIIDGRNVMTTSVKQMMEVANAAVPRITPAQAQEMMGKGNTLVVDVRDAPEVEKSGKVAGAVHVSRGMLEFR